MLFDQRGTRGLGSPVKNELAAVQHHAARSIFEHGAHALLNDHHGGSLLVKTAKDLPYPSCTFPIQMCQRFVQDHDGRFQTENRCNSDQPFLSAGQGRGRPVKEMPDVKDLRGPFYFYFYLSGRPPHAFKTKSNLLFHAAVEKLGVCVLEYQAHLCKKISHGEIPGVVT